jgi:hypothetical protein
MLHHQFGRLKLKILIVLLVLPSHHTVSFQRELV